MKRLKQTTVPSDQVKKIIATRDEFKQKFDAKSAETRQKETELADVRVKADATQKKVTELEASIAKLTEKDKKNEEDAAKEKDKFRRLQQLAKGYRKQGDYRFYFNLSVFRFLYFFKPFVSNEAHYLTI